VAQVEQRFGELRILAECLLVELDGVFQHAAFLADQAGVIKQLSAALAQLNQPAMQLVSFGVVCCSSARAARPRTASEESDGSSGLPGNAAGATGSPQRA